MILRCSEWASTKTFPEIREKFAIFTQTQAASMSRFKTSQERISYLENISNGITSWVGSVQSLVIHTLLFALCFLLPFLGLIDFDKMLAILTNVLSLEAIYLAIFIQMSVNRSSEHIEDLRDDVGEIQEDIEDIQEDIEEISEDIEEMSEDLEEISDDIEDIQGDIEEINEEDAEDEMILAKEDLDTDEGKNVVLESNISENKSAILILQQKIAEMENELKRLRGEEGSSGKI